MRWFKDKREWFTSAKFGMFAHLGLYTLLGGNENAVRKTTSKSAYRRLMRSFNPRQFDARAWASLAVEAGVKYLVPTVKHAEGFCLWDSDVTDLKVTKTPFKRDILKELSDACAEKGIRLGVYYNCETWLNEGDDVWNRRGMSYADFVEAQIRELMTNYGSINVLWFDHVDPQLPPERMKRIIQMTHRLQPSCVVNNRGVNLSTFGKLLGDYVTPERFIPGFVEDRHPFVECCDAIGIHSWGYHTEETFWSTPELIKRLSVCASSGFNYLLNVEPEPSGVIRPECVERMRAIGAWIVRNHAAIAAAPCPLIPVDPSVPNRPALGRTTIAGDALFIHLHQAPKGDEVLVVDAGGEVKGASLLGDKRKLRVACYGGDLAITGLPAAIGPEPLVIEVRFKSAMRRVAWRQAPVPVVEPLPGGTVPLTTDTVRLKAANGVCLHASYHRVGKSGAGRTAICNIFNVGDQLRWKVKLQKAGAYEVFLEIGSVESQSEADFMLEANGAEVIAGKSWITGGCEKPASRRLGKVKLKAGVSDIGLNVGTMPRGSFPDVYGIILVPA